MVLGYYTAIPTLEAIVEFFSYLVFNFLLFLAQCASKEFAEKTQKKCLHFLTTFYSAST